MKLKVNIEFDLSTGELKYTGPNDPMVFTGLLEFVKANLLSRVAQAEQPKQGPRPNIVVPDLRFPKT